MEALYPEDEDSEAAREGTAAHFVASEMIHGRTPAVGTTAPNGVAVTVEMIECAQDFARDVMDTLAAASPGSTVHIEETIPARVNPRNWGTPDAVVVDWKRKIIYIWDYKFGHRYVDIFENWQLLNYLFLKLHVSGVSVLEWQDWTAMLTICQPRNYHPNGPMREWRVTGAKLEPYWSDLRGALAAADVDDAPLKTGEWCRDCNGRHACPALQRAAMSAVDLSLQGQPVDLPNDALGLELVIIREAMKRLGARATGLEEQALFALRNGKSVPHWRNDYSSGRERWKAPVAEVIALGDLLGVDVRAPVAALTPKQAAKKGIDRAVIEAYSETPRGAMALVPFEQNDISKRFG